MKKPLLLIAACLLISMSVSAQKKYSGYAVGFYNQENLFDTCHDAGKNDYDFCLMAATIGMPCVTPTS